MVLLLRMSLVVLNLVTSRDWHWWTFLSTVCHPRVCYSLGSLQEIIYHVCCRRMWLTWAKPRSVLLQKPLGWSETKKTSQATLPNIIAWPRWCSSVWMWANPCSYFPTSTEKPSQNNNFRSLRAHWKVWCEWEIGQNFVIKFVILTISTNLVFSASFKARKMFFRAFAIRAKIFI